MPAINYKARFAEDVRTGRKRSTIRAERKRPFSLDDTLYHYTGMRTKKCRLLLVNRPERIRGIHMFVGGVTLETETGIWLYSWSSIVVARIAVKDGFESTHDMYCFFRETHGFTFHGQLLEW
ncbi:MAG: hypothetical protein JXR37_09105 [Kiritimatiellae bacterium]|nr:hypothetical protein [Kiritimatiellia bacterium]